MSQRIRFTAIALCVSIAGACFAQITRAPLTVKVVDRAGAPLPNAVVQILPLNGQALGPQFAGISFSGITDDQGAYSAQLIVYDGGYQVAAKAGESFDIQQVQKPFPATLTIQLQVDASSLAATAVPSVPATQRDAAASGASATAPEKSDAAPAEGGPAKTPAAPATFWDTVWDLTLTVLLVFAPLISFFLLRWVSVRLVLSYMMRKAPQGSTFGIGEQPSAEAAGGAAELELLTVNNTNGVLLNGAAQERLERAQASGRRTLRPFLLSLLAGLGAALVLMAGMALLDSQRAPVAGMVAAGSGGLFLVSLAFGMYCYQFVRRLAIWVNGFAALLTLGAGIAAWKLAGIPPYLAFVPGVVQAATAWFFIRRNYRAIEEAGNQRLIILRVFGSDKYTAYTFGSLMDRWRFVGSFLTIVDPSYIRFKFAAISPFTWKRTAASTFWYAIAAGLLGVLANIAADAYPGLLPASFKAMPTKDRVNFLSNAGYLLMVPLAILPIFFYVTSRFAKSQGQAEERIAKAVEKGKRLRGGVFRGLPVWCFDDVWKPAVRHMLTDARALLMDLRGFTPERKGCAYEIGEIIDRFPIERTVFLVQDNAGKEELFALIRERWARMGPDSPNRREGLRLKIYETKPKPRARAVRRDTERILALLASCVDEEAAERAPAKALVQLA